MSGRYVFDIEAKGFLDAENVDYTASPYCLKEPKEFVHCIGFVNVDDINDRHTFVGYEDIKVNATKFVKENVKELIGHNILGYDNMVMKVAFDWDFYVAADSKDEDDVDMLLGKPIKLTDTLVMSKALNPDRPRHSIEYFGSILGLEKIDWRAKAIELGLIESNAPKGAEFKKYHTEMAVYMMRDCDVNAKVFKLLEKEWGEWDWENAYVLEKAVRELITRQEQRGFFLDEELAEANVKDLDAKMEAIRKVVEPLLPPKPMGKTKQKDFTPPKTQFLKNGQPNAHIKNFVSKHGGELVDKDGLWFAKVFDKEYKLPLPNEPLVTHEPATVKDTTHIKGWLVGLGWSPSVYKERDLTVDFKKKKLTQEKYEEVVERYVAQTLESPFCNDRCDELDVRPSQLKSKLLKHDIKRPLKVYTNPSFTVGMEKEIDPNLLLLEDKFPHAKTVSEYLTYAHRRNSILGGGVDPDDEDEEAETGFLSSPRIKVDSRVPTPADTCGAGTSRFKHRFICNIPRVTSLYGDRMRGMFGVDVKNGFTQMGYDFDSLEAKIESHYVYKYEGGPEYGVSLTAEKPNDCHSVLARSISKILGREFPRSTAKNVKYGCSYNAQPKRVAKTVGCSLEDGQIIFDAFWQQAFPLKQLKERMQQYWETTGKKKFIMGIDRRKLPIRSKGNVINTAFQSAGVICAKRAMVIHDRLLRKEGLYVDFFKDDWKNANFCQQLIAYHK